MWSAQQQSMLNAMGYTLYVKPGTRAVSASIEPASEMPIPDSSVSADAALFKAVMKAAQGREISQLGIDINALRTSPHAKRALWPQLRKLMKS